MKKGGCFTFIFLLVFALFIFNKNEEPPVENKYINTENFTYINGKYTISVIEKNYPSIEANYNWNFVTTNLKRKNIELQFDLSKNEVDKALLRLNSMISFTIGDLNITADYNTEKERYHRQYWTGIYRYMAKTSSKNLKEAILLLKEIAINEKLNSNDFLQLCITLVQSMEYKIPEFELGIIPPIVSVAEEYGDCDTRAVLLCVILEQLGYDSILYLSRVYTHAMTGIHINSTGLNKVLNNKPYYFLEVTNKGWNIGQIPSDMQDLDLWEPIDLKLQLLP